MHPEVLIVVEPDVARQTLGCRREDGADRFGVVVAPGAQFLTRQLALATGRGGRVALTAAQTSGLARLAALQSH
jgi:hypothetical protein